MSDRINRRSFMKDSALASAAALALGSANSRAADKDNGKANTDLPPLRPVKETLPMGKIGKVTFSRLMLGGNLISGYAHSRDLTYVGQLMKRYNTEGKILETLELAETHGINAVNMAIWDDVSFLEKHWKRGGKMKLIAQALAGPNGELSQFQKAVEMGASAIHMQGHGTETLVEAGKVEVIGKAVEYVKSKGVAAGVAAHALFAIEECEKAKVPVDFYQKTLHTREYKSAARPDEKGYLGSWDNSWCSDAEEVVEFMATVKKPWIAFKVMAAGAIAPRRAFPFAFNSGADFVLAGMFDWQVEEDVALAKQALANAQRVRPWVA